MMLIVLSASLVLGIAYIIVIPPWQSPDEPTHFEYAKVLALGAAPWAPLPSPDLQEKIIVSLDRHDYWRYVQEERPSTLPATFRETPFLFSAPTQIGKNPPLYYLLASLVLRLSPSLSVETELYRLRILSLLFTILTVGLVGAVAAEIFGSSSPVCPAAAGIVAFLPQFMVIGTSVSPDPCINLFGAASIYLVLRFQRTGFTLSRTMFLLLWYGLGLLVNYKCLILLSALPGVMIIHFFLHRPRTLSFKKVMIWFGVIFLVFLVAYSGMVWYYSAIARVFIVRVNILYSMLASFLRGDTYFRAGFWHWFHAELFKSFWLKYGWLKFELPPPVYLVLKIASLFSLAGIGLFLGQWIVTRGKIPSQTREAIITLLFFAAVTLGAYYLFWGLRGEDTTTQGRHLFLVMPAWSILFIFGWSRFFPARWITGVSYGLLAGFILLDAVSILFYIIPTFS
ncbi:MAG: phospholipid carrier-dependent glycosyltransferase [PVC group bacterium]